MKTNQIVWYEDVDESRDGKREIKIFRTQYKGFDITVYPLTKMLKNAKGFEYELFNAKTQDIYDSLFESSNTRISTDSHNDHAKDSTQAKEWAITTVKEWN